MAGKKDTSEKHVTDSASDKGEEEIVVASEAGEAKETVAEGKKSGGESATGKRKAEGEHPDTAITPPKRRNANLEIAEQAIGSPYSSSYGLRSRTIPCFQKVNLNLREFAKTVGKKVKVLKTGTKKLVSGIIESYNKTKKQHTVKLDDGDVMELDMTKDQFELEVEQQEKFELKETRAGRGKSIDDDKGKGIATHQGKKSKKEDFGPKEKIVKLGEGTESRGHRALRIHASNG